MWKLITIGDTFLVPDRVLPPRWLQCGKRHELLRERTKLIGVTHLILAGLAERCLSMGKSYPIPDGLLRQTLIGLSAISRI
ncbi:hypothetical protein [Limnofasciculus baicalensis]|uniref:Uncharacterized protein n=1 Tax=Limnofasciculus baicalensis BBK-W-15 TaxID=2699891 RepID=A0AAE3GPQ9_9CYAN|nr:hypothetical protein [Limnofasciculus baicalensis]MCP2727797.1 hypothetical protein [Limnofasciculus baicalensis BBK-W-15]